jgi:hypothetical protein
MCIKKQDFLDPDVYSYKNYKDVSSWCQYLVNTDKILEECSLYTLCTCNCISNQGSKNDCHF